MAQLLWNRGIDSTEAAEQFLNPSLKNLPSPFLLPDMEKGVARICQAIQGGEKIALFGHLPGPLVAKRVYPADNLLEFNCLFDKEF